MVNVEHGKRKPASTGVTNAIVAENDFILLGETNVDNTEDGSKSERNSGVGFSAWLLLMTVAFACRVYIATSKFLNYRIQVDEITLFLQY